MHLMGRLFDVIRDLVTEDKYLVKEHAAERLEERRIMEWQAVVGLANARLIGERAEARPHPTVEVLELLPDGTEFKASGRIFGRVAWPNW
jgi:hypothetical protein